MKLGQRLLIVLAVLLPVPLAAVTGLTIPLPATVERLAARLVPFADPVPSSGAQPFAAGARGRIVETKDEVTEKTGAIHLAEPGRRARSESRTGRVKKARKTPAGRTHPTHAKREPKAPKPESRTPKPPKPPKPPPLLPKKSKASPAGAAGKVR